MFENDIFLSSYARERGTELRQLAAARALVNEARLREPLRVRIGRSLVRLGIRLATGRTANCVTSLTGRGRVVYEGFLSGR